MFDTYEDFMKLYKQVSKEEYDSFIANYFAKNSQNKGVIKSECYMDWYELYDIAISKAIPIVRSSPIGEYYILKEILENGKIKCFRE